MLARTKLRRFAIAAISDEKSPFGPSCDCVGPIWKKCNDDPVEILDSPAGYVGERIESLLTQETELPVIAVYVEDRGGDFADDNGFPKRTTNLTLLIEVFVTGSRERIAEDTCDEMEERILYRLFRRDEALFGDCPFTQIVRLRPTEISTRTEREKSDQIVFVRSIQINLQSCDEFQQPECTPETSLCADVHVSVAAQTPNQ